MSAWGSSTEEQAERERIEVTLSEISDRASARAVPQLAGPVVYALSTSGKRIRPLLCLAAYRAGGGRSPVPHAAIRLSCAPEIVHTYSLVHDDLPSMDDDAMRRGRPTVHRVFGCEMATLAGAALLPIAARITYEAAEELGLEPAAAGRILVELCGAAGAEGMVGGQLLDLQAETREIDPARLEAIHRAKTGALLTASLRIGGIAACAPETVLQDLTTYGEWLGLAFQIADDILDVVGDPAALGKTAGRDEALRKASYPSLHGVERARSLARDAADAAKAAVAHLSSAELEALADYVVERRR